MRIYHVTINGQEQQLRSSSARVAVQRAMSRYTDTQMDGAAIHVRRGRQIEYAYRVIAMVPCEPSGASKRDFVSAPMSEDEASVAVETIRATHPEYDVIHVRRVEVEVPVNEFLPQGENKKEK